jgi:hypothetical protein
MLLLKFDQLFSLYRDFYSPSQDLLGVDYLLYLPCLFRTYMGRVEKGVNCSVQGCEQSAQRSMSGSKARMASDLVVNSDKRVYLCKTHYKEWKKATKDDRENERARWQ